MSASAINNATAVASDPLLAADEDSFEEFTADGKNANIYGRMESSHFHGGPKRRDVLAEGLGRRRC